MTLATRLKWYLKRLSVMSFGEIMNVWVFRTLRDLLPNKTATPNNLSFDFSPIPLGWKPIFKATFEDARTEILVEADAVLKNRLTVFGRTWDCGLDVDWNRDYSTGAQWPLMQGSRFAIHRNNPGDPKPVWELNRHGFLPTLGIAYYLTDDERYANQAIRLMTSWIEQCPPHTGIHWTSGIELALRQMAWCFTLHFLGGCESLTAQARDTICKSMYLQTRHIARNLSLYSSANNHLIAELAGMVMVGHHLGCDPWVIKGLRLAEQHSNDQILEDGVGAEQSTAYQLNTTELLFLCALVAKQRRTPVSEKFLARLYKSATFLSNMLEGDGLLPIGDGDDTRIVPLCLSYPDVKSVLNLIAWFTEDYTSLQTDVHKDQKTFWLAGPKDFGELANREPRQASDGPHAYPNGGYYILERTCKGKEVKLLFDCGPLGLPPLAAHGHADALSVILIVDGEAVLIDPGTYAYHKDNWRSYFRGTAAHNTIRIDGMDQSEYSGKFLATLHASSECLDFVAGHRATGQHTGYTRLKDPLTHTRNVEFLGNGECLRIEDTLDSKGTHKIEQLFHVDRRWRVNSLGSNQFVVHSAGGELLMQMDKKMETRLAIGDKETLLGWSSPAFGSKEPTHTILGEMQSERTTLTTEIYF